MATDSQARAEQRMRQVLEECEVLINGARSKAGHGPMTTKLVSAVTAEGLNGEESRNRMKSIRAVPGSPRCQSANLSFNYMLASLEKHKLGLTAAPAAESAYNRMYRSMDSRLYSGGRNFCSHQNGSGSYNGNGSHNGSVGHNVSSGNDHLNYKKRSFGSSQSIEINRSGERLVEAERRLTEELLNKNKLTSQVSDLMAELRQLQTQLSEAQAERDAYKDKFTALQNDITKLAQSLSQKESEIEDLRRQLNNNLKNASAAAGTNGHVQTSLDSADGEREALKKAVNDLLAENDEKDMKIEELRKAVSTYQKVEEIILSSAVSRSNRPKSEDSATFHSTSITPTKDRKFSVSSRTASKPSSPYVISDGAPPVPKHGFTGNSLGVGSGGGGGGCTVPRSSSYDASRFNRIITNEADSDSYQEDADADDNDLPTPLTVAVGGVAQAEWTSDPKPKGSCTSLPRDYGNRLDASLFLSPNKQRLSSGGDNLGSDVFIANDGDEDVVKEHKKKRGLRRFFARMKRSTSQEAVAAGDRAFRRGGVRATAGPRLAGNHKRRNQGQSAKSDAFLMPFGRWNGEQVATWLADLGLEVYAADCRRWCRSGQHMMEASKHELEKELHIHHPLHKKKLHLALDSVRMGNRKEQFVLGGLNSDWISKWLDDIGLPQYKDQFAEASIDGRMLNHLTVDDLLYMKINNALHHLSIGRGIEVLRAHNFNLGTLKRRPSTDRTSEILSSTLNGSCRSESCERDVSLWTNHRLMEWLRMIDLSEYAANLRGSGVHGGLIMLEPRFTVEHLADILVMPHNKTLLRRHLSAHFVNLVGQKVQARKREAEHSPGMSLTLNTKVKAKRPNLFRRNRPTSVYVCPMDRTDSVESPLKGEDKRVKSAVALYKKELNKRQSNGSKKDSKSKTPSSS